MIVVAVFNLILNQMEIHLVQNRKENNHHDHIPFNVKGNGNLIFSVCSVSSVGCVFGLWRCDISGFLCARRANDRLNFAGVHSGPGKAKQNNHRKGTFPRKQNKMFRWKKTSQARQNNHRKRTLRRKRGKKF